MSTEYIRQELRQSILVMKEIVESDSLIEAIFELSKQCADSLLTGGKIIFAGNGGSFADAQHLSAEFTSRFLKDRQPLASIALATNNSVISAIGNDYGYSQVFVRELLSLGKPNDVFIPITTSGNSENLLLATKCALKLGIRTVAFTGKGGGKIAAMCPSICIPSMVTPHIQEAHIALGHIVCGLVEDMLSPLVSETQHE